jgi:rRNA-processing protein FCF1
MQTGEVLLMTARPSAVISDACVLIDYIKVEQTKVLRLVTDNLFPIKLPRIILDEVDGLTEDQAEALGMEIIEATFDQLKEAAMRGGGLSQPDKLCFAIARDNGWGIWTSDKPLHTKCIAEGIPAYWSLQLMLDLCKAGKLDPEIALKTAQKISTVNERINQGIVQNFKKQLNPTPKRL